MTVERLSITLDPRLGAAVRKAAKRAGSSVSAWLAQAASDRVRNELLGRALDAWEAEDGAFSATELAAAERELGFASKPKRSRK
jgi:hypothetical protein